ncbi:hypothetical protein TNCV_2539661 [Trichonephila clavipes]|nr:hypothetical protein TNCV_2539661 [Trichonephila clavipes]
MILTMSPATKGQDNENTFGHFVTMEEFWPYQHGPGTKEINNIWKPASWPSLKRAKKKPAEKIILPVS